jgi:hypothetical protein
MLMTNSAAKIIKIQSSLSGQVSQPERNRRRRKKRDTGLAFSHRLSTLLMK